MRITGGRWRSRALRAPRGSATRPTSDRVREAIFSMLGSAGVAFAAGGRVLDLYAGSGALAFEALSRMPEGEGTAVLVEQARDAVDVIRENARALEAEGVVRVVAAPVLRALKMLADEGSAFEVVLLDPPYAEVASSAKREGAPDDAAARRFGAVLEGAARLVAPGGVLVLEHAARDPSPPCPPLRLDRARRHGDTTVALYL